MACGLIPLALSSIMRYFAFLLTRHNYNLQPVRVTYFPAITIFDEPFSLSDVSVLLGAREAACCFAAAGRRVVVWSADRRNAMLPARQQFIARTILQHRKGPVSHRPPETCSVQARSEA